MSGNLPQGFDQYVESIQDQTRLSPTRAKVLVLMKLHNEKDEIADLLGIATKTVQNHIQDLRKELTAAEELIDIAGPTHYANNSLFKEFGGSMWMFRSGCRYEKNSDTRVEKKIYGSPHGACLFVERTITEAQGSITEERTRTEFYDGNDIPPHLYHNNSYSSYEIAVLHTELLANAGIDPKYSPEELVRDSVSVSGEPTDIVTERNGWLTLVE